MITNNKTSFLQKSNKRANEKIDEGQIKSSSKLNLISYNDCISFP
jgi:hypothetical protein